MFKNQHLRSITVAWAFLMFVLLPSISFAATIQGYVAGIIQFKRSKAMDKEFKGEALKKLGWTKTRTHYQQTIPLPMFSIALGDSGHQKLAEGGVFSLEVQPGEYTIHTFDAEGREVDARKVFLEDEDSVVQVPIIIIKNMEHHCCIMPERGVAAKKKAPPCVDYNNPYGDYEDVNSWPKKGFNFLDSDCARAVKRGHCWTEPMPGRSCNHGGKNCSHFIGHPDGNHCHPPE